MEKKNNCEVVINLTGNTQAIRHLKVTVTCLLAAAAAANNQSSKENQCTRGWVYRSQ